MRARGAQAQTGARARRASKDRRAREVREQGARALRARSLRTRARANKLSKSGFAIWRDYLRARRAYLRARRAYLRARVSDGRLCLLARLARAPVVARAPRTRTC